MILEVFFFTTHSKNWYPLSLVPRELILSFNHNHFCLVIQSFLFLYRKYYWRMNIHTSKKQIPLLLFLSISILQNSLTLSSTMHQMVHTCGNTFAHPRCLTFVYTCKIQVRIKSRYIIKELFAECDWFGVCLWDSTEHEKTRQAERDWFQGW